MSPTMHVVKRLRTFVDQRLRRPRRGAAVGGVEPLEPRLLLTACPAQAAALAESPTAGCVVMAEAPVTAGEPVGDVAWSPTADEQELLEWLNDLRMDPAGNLSRMVDGFNPLHSPYPWIQAALEYFNVDGDALQAEWAALTPVDPLIWNGALMQAARDHSQLMINYDSQSHQLPGELSLGDRMIAAGYTSFSIVAENIFAYAETIPYGHAGFAIDWGWPDPDGDGMQDPPGHRENMMHPALREIGIGVLEDDDDETDVGPLVVTQDFGDRWGLDAPYLTGVVYTDADGDGMYDAGEGLGGATVAITGAGGTVYATTMAAGGYQVAVEAGSYTVEFTQPGYAPVSTGVVATSGRTTKVDGVLAAAQAGIAGRHVFYNDSTLDGATPGPSPQDDNAVAADKQALTPGQTAGAAHRTAYAGGLNGVMVDIAGLADGASLSEATIGEYFAFKTGTGGDPSAWAAADAPVAVAVRGGDGDGDSDRVTIIFDDGAIAGAWLEVTVKATAATGLAAADVFYFGNLPADADGSGAVDLDDFAVLKQHFGTAAGIAAGDFDLTGAVDLDDFAVLKQHFGASLDDPLTAAAVSSAGEPAAAASARPSPGPALRRLRARRRTPARRPRRAAAVDLLAAATTRPLG